MAPQEMAKNTCCATATWDSAVCADATSAIGTTEIGSSSMAGSEDYHIATRPVAEVPEL